MNTIETRDIVKRYANHTALKKVSIQVPKGSIYGLLGPNGAGKTSLIRIINRITAPDEGEVLFNGKALRQNDVERIGYLPEERGLYKKMKTGEQALYLAQLKGVDEKTAKERLKKWFVRLNITDWWDKKVEELSKGMQQKVQFITTVIHEPELLIFDEPFSGFDPINVNILKEEILRLRDEGATIIFSTHNMASVEEICDHIALINKSEKILEGKLNEIRESFKSNLYEIKIRDFGGFIPGFENEITEKKDQGLHRLSFSTDDGDKARAFLAEIAAKEHVVDFREIYPSVNDIFLSKTSEKAHS